MNDHQISSYRNHGPCLEKKKNSINNKKIKGDQHVWNLSVKWSNFYELYVYLIIILAFCK
jgi:hypothetical protein